jgi:hypothetical protein
MPPSDDPGGLRFVTIDFPIHGPRPSKLTATELAQPPRSTTRSTILHFPQRPAPASAPPPAKKAPMTQDLIKASIVANMTAAERHFCKQLNVAPSDWAEQRMLELATGRTDGVSMADVPPPERSGR